MIISSLSSNLKDPLSSPSHSFHDKASTSITPPCNQVIKLRCCPCGRRHFLEAAAATLLSPSPANASDYKAILNRLHPPKPDWYEEFYASVLDSGSMESYEAEISAYKSELFTKLRRRKAKKVLEIGIGTGPNLKYYAGRDADVEVFGVDPNPKMEKYALEAAKSAGLLPANFNFIQAVGEAIPLDDASVDAVIGTLVLCSVTDVDQTLQEVKRVLRPGGVYVFVEHVAAKDGTLLRFVQNVVDPLQQIVADGCHLTRETGNKIFESGFSTVDLNTALLSNAAFINPQVYGIATR
ncbi:S-adenosyl-L-methionine-dependent methyltransferases superfamily protein [Euphorbia peplus]|nr:S-adenosyl-L-methionine-dependent methyltransferases superfamily protein [Euphorbia peplus]